MSKITAWEEQMSVSEGNWKIWSEREKRKWKTKSYQVTFWAYVTLRDALRLFSWLKCNSGELTKRKLSAAVFNHGLTDHTKCSNNQKWSTLKITLWTILKWLRAHITVAHWISNVIAMPLFLFYPLHTFWRAFFFLKKSRITDQVIWCYFYVNYTLFRKGLHLLTLYK